MSKSMDTICVHGKEHAVKDQNYAISYPIYQTASFSHLTSAIIQMVLIIPESPTQREVFWRRLFPRWREPVILSLLLPEWLPLRRCLNISSRETM